MQQFHPMQQLRAMQQFRPMQQLRPIPMPRSYNMLYRDRDKAACEVRAVTWPVHVVTAVRRRPKLSSPPPRMW